MYQGPASSRAEGRPKKDGYQSAYRGLMPKTIYAGRTARVNSGPDTKLYRPKGSDLMNELTQR